MKAWKKFTIAVLVVVILSAVYGLFLLRRGFSAHDQPSSLEGIVARAARNLAIPHDAARRTMPRGQGHGVGQGRNSQMAGTFRLALRVAGCNERLGVECRAANPA